MALAGILGKGRFSFILASGFREVFYSLTLKISGNSDLFPRLQEYKGSGRGEGGGPLQGRSVAATTNSTRRRRRGSRGSFISDSNRVRARTTYTRKAAADLRWNGADKLPWRTMEDRHFCTANIGTLHTNTRAWQSFPFQISK